MPISCLNKRRMSVISLRMATSSLCMSSISLRINSTSGEALWNWIVTKTPSDVSSYGKKIGKVHSAAHWHVRRTCMSAMHCSTNKFSPATYVISYVITFASMDVCVDERQQQKSTQEQQKSSHPDICHLSRTCSLCSVAQLSSSLLDIHWAVFQCGENERLRDFIADR